MLIKQLIGERCRECSLWEMFFNWSMMVSIMARFRSSRRSAKSIKRFFILRLNLVISCTPMLSNNCKSQLLRDVAQGARTLCQIAVAAVSQSESGHRCCQESGQSWATLPCRWRLNVVWILWTSPSRSCLALPTSRTPCVARYDGYDTASGCGIHKTDATTSTEAGTNVSA